MANSFDGFTIDSFSGSIDQVHDEQGTNQNNASNTYNCAVEDGNLSRVKGSTLSSSVAGITVINELMPYYHGGTSDILVVSNGGIYKVGTSIGTGFTSNVFDYVNYQIDDTELIIMVNGKENPKTYNGTALADLKNRMKVYDYDNLGHKLATFKFRDENGTLYNTSDECPSHAPICSFIELHKERLWMAEGQTVYCSCKYDPLDWMIPLDEIEANQHGGSIDIPTWDGGKIIGLKSLFNDLVVFKSKSVHRIFGTDVTNFSIDQIFNTVNGKIVDKTICSRNNQAFWLSSEGIFIYNGVDVTDLSKRISRVFKTLNVAAIDTANAVMFKDKYILSIPVDGSTTPNLVIEFDTTKNSFYIRKGLTIVSMIEYGQELLFTDGTNNIFKYNVGESYNGALINSLWVTPKLTFNAQNAIKNLYMVYFNGTGNGSVRLRVTNEKGKTKYKDVDLTVAKKFHRVSLKISGRVLQFEIENLNGCDFTIKQPQFIMDLDFD